MSFKALMIKYTKNQIDNKSIRFLLILKNKIKKKILKIASSITIENLKFAESELIPSKLIQFSSETNPILYLKHILTYIILFILKTATNYVFKYKSVIHTCILISILLNEDLTRLCQNIGIIIPTSTTSTLTRTELLEQLTPYYSKIKKLDTKLLTLLHSPPLTYDTNILLDFYKNTTPILNITLPDFLNMTNDQITLHFFIFDWLFPIHHPYFSYDIQQIFKTDSVIQQNIYTVLLKLLQYYGIILFPFKNNSLTNYTNITNNGLFLKKNHPILLNMLTFLQFMNTPKLNNFATLLMLHICTNVQSNFMLFSTLKPYILPFLQTFSFLNTSLFSLETFEKSCTFIPIKGLQYNNNSCYLDSSLIAIFASPNQYIKSLLRKNIETFTLQKDHKCIDVLLLKKIQNNLKYIYNYIHYHINIPSYTCTKFRKLIRTCPNSDTWQEKFYDKNEHDAGEFMIFIFNIFEFKILNRTVFTYVTNDLDPHTTNWIDISKISIQTEPIITIHTTDLLTDKMIDLSTYLNYEEDVIFDVDNMYKKDESTSFQRKKTIYVNDSNFIVFQVFRTLRESEQIWKKIHAPAYIFLNNKNLFLTSIVTHTGFGHYICFFKFKSTWFLYNDLEPLCTFIGSYDKMIHHENKPLQYGTLFIYVN